jgi:hypothetical protein
MISVKIVGRISITSIIIIIITIIIIIIIIIITTTTITIIDTIITAIMFTAGSGNPEGSGVPSHLPLRSSVHD